jgi:hypothetical protein
LSDHAAIVFVFERVEVKMRTFMLTGVAALSFAAIGTAYGGQEQYQYGTPSSNTSTATQAAPAGEGFPGAGANGLYTRLQAQGRIMSAGFTDVTGLSRNSRANWHGQAMRANVLNWVNVDAAGDVTSSIVR